MLLTEHCKLTFLFFQVNFHLDIFLRNTRNIFPRLFLFTIRLNKHTNHKIRK